MKVDDNKLRIKLKLLKYQIIGMPPEVLCDFPLKTLEELLEWMNSCVHMFTMKHWFSFTRVGSTSLQYRGVSIIRTTDQTYEVHMEQRAAQLDEWWKQVENADPIVWGSSILTILGINTIKD